MGKVGCKCRRWTQYERDYVEDKWGLISVSRIAKHLDRTEGAVRRYAEKNKLGGSCFNDFLYTIGQIAEELKVDHTVILENVRLGKLKATSRKIKSRKIYLVEPEDFEEFKKVFKSRNYSVWTILQERRLLELVKEGKTNKEISIIMNKSVDSIANKRTRLLLKENEK